MPKVDRLDELVVIGFQTQPRDDAERYITGIQSTQIGDAERAKLRLDAATTPYLCELESVTMHLISDSRETQSVYLTKPDGHKGLLGPKVVAQFLEWYPLLFNEKTGEVDYRNVYPVLTGFDIELFAAIIGLECAEQKVNICPNALIGGLWGEDIREQLLPKDFCKNVPLDLAVKRLGITLLDNLGFVSGMNAEEDALVTAQAVAKLNMRPYLNKKIQTLVESLIDAAVEDKPKPTPIKVDTSKKPVLTGKRKLKPKAKA